MRIRRVSAVAVSALVMLCLLLGGRVSAHHSRAGVYENDKRIEMKGVVAEWRWRNPHVFLVWDVTDDKGKVVQWIGELSSITSMVSEGMSRNSFKGGEKITVMVVPARAGTPQGQLIKVVMADGSVPLDRTRGPIPD